MFSCTTSDEEPFAIKKMHVFSTVDGFVEITESLMDMIKFIANEPSAGLFYVQQHTHTAVPNLINLTSKTEGKSRQVTLHTADSIVMVRSMKECGFKWPQMDAIESKPAKNDEPSVICSNDDTTLPADDSSCTRGQQR